MKEVEYMIRRLPSDRFDILGEWETFLNDQAALGWKVVHFEQGRVSSPGFVIFEAEVNET